MRNTLLSFLAAGLLIGLGCSKTDSSGGVALVSVEQDSPAEVVVEFLDAVRLGKSEQASAKLTPLALKRIEEEGMDFAPPASETAQFRVGEIEMFEEDKAFVDSVWIEKNADGSPYEENMTWGLRLTELGWRISGMAAHMGPGQPPVLVNFENPGQLIDALSPVGPSQQDGIPRQAMQPSGNRIR